MKTEIVIPAVGESVTEATIGAWLKKNGEFVKRNEPVLSLETDKASVEVAADGDGVLEIKVQQGQTIPIGTVVAIVDSDAKPTVASEPKKSNSSTPSSATSTSASSTGSSSSPGPVATPSTSSFPQAHPELQAHLSPAVQRVVNERGLDPSQISGTGRGGRLTKGDALSAPNQETPSTTAQELKTPAPEVSRPSKQGDIQRVPMSNIRKRIATRLVEAQHTAAILTTFNEIDMTAVTAFRNKYKDSYKEKYNVSLGFMGFFVKATISALKAWPAVNASIEGSDLIYKNFYNIGVAVGTDKGLVVPIIKDADLMSIAEIELAIKKFALKARDGKISVDDLSGGTFTISNGGVYGSLMSTPILTPPQSAILGMHKIEDRPVVIDKKIEVRPMMYVALSYDHRIIDGKEAVSFLVRIKECIENPERILLEI